MRIDTQEDITTMLQQHIGYRFMYKHSHTCSRSLQAEQQLLQVLEKYPETPIIYINVRQQRPLSDRVEEYFHIQHESPQLITFKKGDVKDVKNHQSITAAYMFHTLGKDWNKEKGT